MEGHDRPHQLADQDGTRSAAVADRPARSIPEEKIWLQKHKSAAR